MMLDLLILGPIPRGMYLFSFHVDFA